MSSIVNICAGFFVSLLISFGAVDDAQADNADSGAAQITDSDQVRAGQVRVEFETFRGVEGVASPQLTVSSQQQISNLFPSQDYTSVHTIRDHAEINFCDRIDTALRRVSMGTCLAPDLHSNAVRTANNSSIFYTEFPRLSGRRPLGRVLLLGGVHGNETASVSLVMKWTKTLTRYHSGLFEWLVVPLLNPDGFFKKIPTRTNGNGVDLNRNLPTTNWDQMAISYWKKRAGGSKHKYPGNSSGSEVETQWLIERVRSFRPDVIISVHAPYNLVDFDAWDRSIAPKRLGMLKGRQLGTFPGSLGKYAGEQQNIPVVTIELPDATRLPKNSQVRYIWLDLIAWLKSNIKHINGTSTTS